MTYMVDYLYGWSPAGTDYEGKIVGQADRAISVARDDPRGYYVKSAYLHMTHRANEAIQVADDGLATNPNSAQLYQARGLAEVALGRFDQAISDAEQAIRLSPRDPQVGLWRVTMGDAGIPEGDRCGLSQSHGEYGRRLCAPRQDGRGEVSAGGSASRQSQTDTERFAIPPTLAEGLRKAGLPEE
jgi:tetratricopeptide (TPR) repeat protein